MLVGDHGDFTCFFIVMFGSEHIFTLRLLVSSGFTLQRLDLPGFTLRWLKSVRIYIAIVGVIRIYLVMVKVGQIYLALVGVCQDLPCDSWSPVRIYLAIVGVIRIYLVMVGVARIYLAIFESPRIYLEIVGVQSGFTLRWLESSGFTLRWLVFVRTHLAMVGVCWLLVVLVCLAHDEDVVAPPEGVGVHLDRVQVGVRVSPLCL